MKRIKQDSMVYVCGGGNVQHQEAAAWLAVAAAAAACVLWCSGYRINCKYIQGLCFFMKHSDGLLSQVVYFYPQLRIKLRLVIGKNFYYKILCHLLSLVHVASAWPNRGGREEKGEGEEERSGIGRVHLNNEGEGV